MALLGVYHIQSCVISSPIAVDSETIDINNCIFFGNNKFQSQSILLLKCNMAMIERCQFSSFRSDKNGVFFNITCLAQTSVMSSSFDSGETSGDSCCLVQRGKANYNSVNISNTHTYHISTISYHRNKGGTTSYSNFAETKSDGQGVCFQADFISAICLITCTNILNNNCTDIFGLIRVAGKGSSMILDNSIIIKNAAPYGFSNTQADYFLVTKCVSDTLTTDGNVTFESIESSENISSLETVLIWIPAPFIETTKCDMFLKYSLHCFSQLLVI